MAQTPRFETLELDEARPGVLLATLNRPEHLNAMNMTMFHELTVLASTVESREDCRVLVLTGAGKAFCAGGDVANMERLAEYTSEEMIRHQQIAVRSAVAIRSLPIPVIAAVNGVATGGGLTLALAADIRYGSPDARFNAAFTRLGFTGGQGGTSWLLPRLIGWGMTSELLLTGRFVDADEAERITLLNRVVPAEQLMEHALRTAETIAALPPAAVRATKSDIRVNLETASFGAAIELENRGQVIRGRDEEMHKVLAEFIEHLRSGPGSGTGARADLLGAPQ